MTSDLSLHLADKLIQKLLADKRTIVTVESCTGGALANAITNIPGSGDVFKDGFVVYSNEAKIALGVPADVLSTHSVYSVETAQAMAKTGVTKSTSKPLFAVGITGSLNRDDPNNKAMSNIGDVYIAIIKNDSAVYRHKLSVPASLSRPDAKLFVVEHILKQLLKLA